MSNAICVQTINIIIVELVKVSVSDNIYLQHHGSEHSQATSTYIQKVDNLFVITDTLQSNGVGVLTGACLHFFNARS